MLCRPLDCRPRCVRTNSGRVCETCRCFATSCWPCAKRRRCKGIAHIGVIQALEENDIPIDYVSGTSMGAIVGGLYAAGYTPQEMMELLTSPGFSYWSSGKTDPAYVYYFSRDEPTSSMLTIPVAPGDSTARHSSVAASLISPLPMNFAFMELFAPYTAQCGGNFDRLFVPFRCVASDVEAQCKVVHSDGSLGDAIRTSMTFPIVFNPYAWTDGCCTMEVYSTTFLWTS